MNKKIYSYIFICVIIIAAVFVYSIFFSDNNIQLTDQPTTNNQTNDRIADKIYTNNEYGYSISLPSGWTMKNLDVVDDGNFVYNDANVGLFAPVSHPERLFGGSIAIQVEKNLNEFESAAEYVDDLIGKYEIEDEYGNPPTPLRFEERSTMVLGEHEGVLIKNMYGPGGYWDVIYVVRGDYVYEFRYNDSDENNIGVVTNEFRATVHDILGTIKFF